MKKEVLARPVLVGRDAQLRELHCLLNSAIAGKGATVFVSGEAGAGKTRLADEFLAEAKKKAVIILNGWCLSNTAVPYFPFFEAFNEFFLKKRESNEFDVKSCLLGPSTTKQSGMQSITPQLWKDQTFIAVANALSLISAKQPVILFIDDLHWADSASLALLHYLARAVKGSERVLVLATFRSEELTNTSEGYPCQLVETLSLMRREDLFSEIKLLGLDQACVCKMAESMLSGTLRQSLAEKLSVKSEGNPLFVVESILMLNEQENLILENNEWTLAENELAIPSKIKDVIVHRLSRLNYFQRKLLDAASVIGDQFDVGLLSAIMGEDSLEVMEALNFIAFSTSIVRLDENRYSFDHSASREILYESLVQPLRCGYHERIAKVLESTKTNPLPFSALAFHYAQAENKEKAIKFALAAAQDELARWSNVQAAQHFRYVLQNIPEGSSQLVKERMTALEGLGDALLSSSRFKESIYVLENLATICKTNSVKLRALRKASQSAFLLGDAACLAEIVKKASPFAAADPLENARILMIRASVFHLQRDWLRDKKITEEASRIFRAKYSLWDIAWSLMMLGGIHGSYLEETKKKGIAETLVSAALFGELRDFHMQMAAQTIAGTVFNSCMLEDEASKMFLTIADTERKIKSGDYLRLAIVYCLSTWPLIQRGSLTDALSVGLKSLELLEKTDSPIPRGQIFSRLTEIYALLGNVDDAEKYFNRLMKLSPEVFAHEFVNGFLAKAVFHSCKDQWKEAEESFNECYKWLKTSPVAVWENIVSLFHSWALDRQGCFEQAVSLRQKAQKTRLDTEASFDSFDLQTQLLVPSKVEINQPFELRLYLIAVSRKIAYLAKIEGLIPPKLKIISSSLDISSHGSVDMRGKKLDPFALELIRVNLQAMEPGIFCLSPRISCTDNLHRVHTYMSKQVRMTVNPAKNKVPIAQTKLYFESEASEKAFNYLVTAFNEDLSRHKLPLEKSGWRTLSEVSKKAQITMYGMYGRRGRGGETTKELSAHGIVESRLFTGEKGRGGRVLKIRVIPDKIAEPDQKI